MTAPKRGYGIIFYLVGSRQEKTKTFCEEWDGA